MKFLKKFQLFAVLALIFALLAGCGGNADNANENAANNDVEQTETNAENDATNEENNEAAENEATEIGGEMILATTTSTFDSGLLDDIVPIFEEQTGVKVDIIAVGTGAALAMGEKGEADALLTHAPEAEEEIEAAGYVINRHRVMHNDYVILGPVDDPAGIEGLPIAEAFAKIAESGESFFSRGDDSGTHKKELAVWEAAGVSTEFDGYEETGSGMGDTLRTAAELGGYLLTDRGTYLSLQEELDTLKILVEGDEELLNIYHVMQVNPEKFDHELNTEAAEAFVEFMLDPEIQERIGNFGVDQYGEPLFFPNQ